MKKEIINKLKKHTFSIITKFPFVVNYIANKQSQNYWVSQNSWRVKDIFYDRAIRQEQFLKKEFVPLLKKDSVICDLACACGDFAFVVAPYVKKIEGFDLSPGMVKLANKTAKDKKVSNAHFYQADACNQTFKKYDHFMCLGLFTCIIDDKKADDIIKKIAKSIKIKGYLVVKDTFNTSGKDIIHLIPGDPYSACYRSRKKYLELFKKNNFKLIKETELSKGSDNRFYSFCGIFQKIK